MSEDDDATRYIEQVRLAVNALLERVMGLERAAADAQRAIEEWSAATIRGLKDGSDPLVESLRERAAALAAEVDLIAAGVTARSDGIQAQAPAPQPESEPEPQPEHEPQPVPERAEPEPEPGTELTPDELAAAAEQFRAGAEPEAQPTAAEEAPTADDDRTGIERARLLALNMALGGTSRADAERQLRDDLEIEDPAEILDEAYGEAR